MGGIIRLIIILLGIMIVASIIILLVKRKINERNSILWISGAFFVFIFSSAPDTLGILANFVGVDYPPALLFLFATIAIMAIVLYQSIQISVLQERLNELTQQTSIQHMNGSVTEVGKGEQNANK